jgi:cytochrome c-type biogenesis protein CcmF
MWQTLPDFGTLVLQVVLVIAAYAFAQAVLSISGRPRLLVTARLSAYAATCLVFAATLLLAYAFLTHDFRIRYVARYSDRSMPTGYLLAALWGGQDGSLLWWSALLSLYTAACLRFIEHRYRRLEPVMIATLMVILSFFVTIMLFAANPFQTSVQGAVSEGEGLNPLLQNYWMILHPPILYVGFVGCTIPFVFAVAALITGRLDNDWILGVRKWMLFAWLALSVGNVLGMVWAYEELGWGGFWAWDPVENASALPWFTATAYLHSTMIQERRNSFKVWNVVLICLTFFLTLFGTFLTRSGIVTSVHSFAHSNIGVYFLWFMSFVVAASAGLIVWRLPQLRAENEVEALLSREATFVVNNWALVGLMVFVTGATLFPKISEWLYQESIILGPPFFNRWTAPLGLLLFLLMGLAPLFGWRKTSSKALKKAFVFPVAITFVFVSLHIAFGKALGLPAVVLRDISQAGVTGQILQKISSITPGVTIALCAFNVAVVLQEVFFGLRARRTAMVEPSAAEGFFLSLYRLVAKSRRRYGGYVVHLGVTAMYLGFVGTVWSSTKELNLRPGSSFDVAGYRLEYRGARLCPGSSKCSPKEQAEVGKHMLFADLDVSRGGKHLTRLSPARFVYQRGEGMTTTEVALLRSLGTDLYVVLAAADPSTDEAQMQVHGNPLVSWIWIGIFVMTLGATISLWPEVSLGKLGPWKVLRTKLSGSGKGAVK